MNIPKYIQENIKNLGWVIGILAELKLEGKITFDDYKHFYDSAYSGNDIPFSGFDLRRKTNLRKVIVKKFPAFVNADFTEMEKRIKHRHCAKCVYNTPDGCKSPGCPWNGI